MVKKREEAEVDRAEQLLCTEQNARKRPQHAQHKPFLHEIKANAKVMKARMMPKRELRQKLRQSQSYSSSL